MFAGCFGYFFGMSSSGSSSRKYWTAGNLRAPLVKIKKSRIEAEYILYQENILGKGGCGIVCLGEGKKSRQKYAVKIVEKKDIERVRFDRELKLLKEVDHTNIVRLFAVYDSSAKFYFVMELCTGGHLGHFITKQNNGYLSEATCKTFFKQLMSAVAHMHSRGIAHRDIKLQNILLDQDQTSAIQLKLIDFGFGSKFLGALPMRSNVGTLYTTAPEVMKESYDERCDVWSAGVVLYIMLSGKRPFENYNDKGEVCGTKQDIIDNILAAKYHFNHSAWKQVSRAGINFVKALLRPDYKTRVHSTEALCDAWFENAPVARVSQAVSAKAVANMKRLLTSNVEIVQTGMMVAAFALTSTSASDLRVVFQSFDTDSSGALSKSEFKKAIQQLAPELSKSDISILFDHVDIDKNGSITYTEFLAATLDPKEVDIGDLSNAFRLMDEDGNGTISKQELYQIIKNTMEQAFQNSIKSEEGKKHLALSKIPSLAQQNKLLSKNSELSESRKSLDTLPTQRSSKMTLVSNNDSSPLPTARVPSSKDDMEKMITDKVNKIFSQVDKNNDGVISESEFLWAMTGMEYHLKSGGRGANTRASSSNQLSTRSASHRGSMPRRSTSSVTGRASFDSDLAEDVPRQPNLKVKGSNHAASQRSLSPTPSKQTYMRGASSKIVVEDFH